MYCVVVGVLRVGVVCGVLCRRLLCSCVRCVCCSYRMVGSVVLVFVDC